MHGLGQCIWGSIKGNNGDLYNDYNIFLKIWCLFYKSKIGANNKAVHVKPGWKKKNTVKE